MRVPQEVVTLFADAIGNVDTEETRDDYRKAGLSDRRYRWDLLWYVIDSHNGDPDSRVGYAILEGYNDDHIDTMLRKIVQPITQPVKEK